MGTKYNRTACSTREQNESRQVYSTAACDACGLAFNAPNTKPQADDDYFKRTSLSVNGTSTVTVLLPEKTNFAGAA